MNELVLNDEVVFTIEGETLSGVIEAINGEVYTVRVYAIAGDEMVATDRVLELGLSDLEKFSIEIENEEMEDDDLEEEATELEKMLAEIDAEEEEALKELFGDDEKKPEPEAQPIAVDSFVEYESEGGKVVGKVTEVLPEGFKIEVYEEQADGFIASGIMVEQPETALKLCDAPKMGSMKRLPRFADRLKKAEVSEDAEVGTVKGYLSIFDNVDLGGDVVKQGAFKRTLEAKGGKTVFMLDHGYKTSEVLGVIELEEDLKGLKMTGKINLKTSQGRDAFETIKFQTENGVPIGASIGYEPVKYGRNSEGGYDLQEVKLYEGSVTPFPMNTEAMITEASKRFNRVNREKRAKLYQTLKSA
jgi:HK97 family phage prohead protease